MKKVGFKISDNLDLIQSYLEFTKPIHKISPLGMKVLSQFINTYVTLKEKVLDEKLLNKLVFDPDVRSDIMKSLELSKNSLANVESELRKKGVIVDGTLNNNIIPELDNGNLKLLIYLYR